MINVKVKRKTIHDLDKAIPDGAKKTVTAVLGQLQTQAKLNAPVDTGLLRGSIQKQQKGVSGSVESNVEYAYYQEYGTKFMAAANGGKGFFRPAAEIVKKQLSDIIRAVFKTAIRNS